MIPDGVHRCARDSIRRVNTSHLFNPGVTYHHRYTRLGAAVSIVPDANAKYDNKRTLLSIYIYNDAWVLSA